MITELQTLYKVNEIKIFSVRMTYFNKCSCLISICTKIIHIKFVIQSLLFKINKFFLESFLHFNNLCRISFILPDLIGLNIRRL